MPTVGPLFPHALAPLGRDVVDRLVNPPHVGPPLVLDEIGLRPGCVATDEAGRTAIATEAARREAEERSDESELFQAAHAALYAMRMLDEESKLSKEIEEPIRVALARSYACLEAALLGRPKPTF